jgi:hypothetical protein
MNIPLPRDRWLSYTDTLIWGRGSLDDSSWSCFLRAASLQINSQDAVQEVTRRIKDAGDHPKKEKLARQVKRAYTFVGTHADEPHLPKVTKPVYQPNTLRKVADRVELNVTPEWLAARSPFSAWNRSPAGFLHKLYRAGEKIIIFDIFESQGVTIWTHPGETANLANLNHITQGKKNVWYLANPVDGRYHWNPRQDKRSRRSEESITSWRYWVIESDKAPKDLWLRALVQFPLPIAAIYDSGGNSIHALVSVNAASKCEWDFIVRRELGPLIVPLGGDFDAMTAVRLSRLPNCHRGETGRLQRLLYLNPEPDCTPIAHREVAHGA